MITAQAILLQWLSDGDLRRVLTGLQLLARETNDDTLTGDATSLSGRHHHLLADRRRDVIGQADYQLELAKIRQALLEVVQALPNDLPAGTLADIPPTADGVLPKAISWKKIGAGIVALLAILASVAEFTGVSLKDVFSAKTAPTDTTQTIPLDTARRAPVISSTDPFSEKNSPPFPEDPFKSKITNTLLTVQCKTNKGRLNLHYRAGETMRLFAKASHPCYLRTLYRLADGKTVQMEADQQVTAAQTNQWIELGAGFTCDEPFGQEQLYVFAQTGPFSTLRIEKSGDYDLILDDLPASLRKTRGFKKKYRYAEDWIGITTTQ